jgi:membrane associated rhomboid family serine protease
VTERRQEIDTLVALQRFDNQEKVHEFGLVVLSQGCGYWVESDEEGGYRLCVEASEAGRLRHQLDLYAAESRHWPPREPEMPEAHPGAYAAMTWMTALVLAWLSQQRWPELIDQGRLSADAVRSGEVYRTFTALFLHSDFAHLTGNLVFGAVFIHLVARHIGTLRAWLGMLAAGTLGNLVNALTHFDSPHYSIGASTAVFGSVGVLVALPLGFAFHRPQRAITRFWIPPLVIGLVFLAWFGTGDLRTDTTAHLFGFLCGLPVGLLAGLRVKS